MGLGSDDLTAQSSRHHRTRRCSDRGQTPARSFSGLAGRKESDRKGYRMKSSPTSGAGWHGKSIVVLASGDPLFFGIGAKLVEAFGPGAGGDPPERVLGCGRLRPHQGSPGGGVRVVSLHGRSERKRSARGAGARKTASRF
ncbi:MAG: hypothetical protein MZV70_29850 [Desulfobacterales bacterium]|nr:hypothetical protein [Desulfobacterales bacterium]